MEILLDRIETELVHLTRDCRGDARKALAYGNLCKFKLEILKPFKAGWEALTSNAKSTDSTRALLDQCRIGMAFEIARRNRLVNRFVLGSERVISDWLRVQEIMDGLKAPVLAPAEQAWIDAHVRNLSSPSQLTKKRKKRWP